MEWSNREGIRSTKRMFRGYNSEMQEGKWECWASIIRKNKQIGLKIYFIRTKKIL